MSDAWDHLLANADAELVAEIKADLAAYTTYTAAGNTAAAIVIEEKYGFFGLSSQQVSAQLHEMTLPMEGLIS